MVGLGHNLGRVLTCPWSYLLGEGLYHAVHSATPVRSVYYWKVDTRRAERACRALEGDPSLAHDTGHADLAANGSLLLACRSCSPVHSQGLLFASCFQQVAQS
jgi:hypothetical protein